MFLQTVINTAAVSLLSAVILSFVVPLPVPTLSLTVLVVSTAILLFGQYRILDGLSKFVMICLTLATVLAVAIAASRGAVAPEGYVSESPWQLGALAFIVALMGWMPAPIEISAINSMWVVAKKTLNQSVLSGWYF